MADRKLTSAPHDAGRPTVSIVVISYNTREMTTACLRSVMEQTRDLSYEIIVVDNASADGSAEAISLLGSPVRLIASPSNLGFAAANNLAGREARGEYLLLLNPDTLILDDAIGRLVAFARANPKAGIWGGRTFFGDGRLDPGSCWRRMTPWSQFCIATGLASTFKSCALFNVEGYGDWPVDRVREVDIVSGCFLLIAAPLWNQLEGFDSLFFMYGEDADLCLRARKLGARPLMTPSATIIHYGAASDTVRAEKLIRLFKARVSLINRYWTGPERVLGLPLLLLHATMRVAGFAFVRLVRPSQRAHASMAAWRAVLGRCREWRGGFELS